MISDRVLYTILYKLCVSSPSDPTTQSVVQPHLLLPAALMSATATTPPITRRLGWHRQPPAGRLWPMAAMANTISTTWTLTQTRTPTLHPQPHAPSTCQLKRAAPHPLPQSVPTSTCAPLLPRPAPTPRDPPIAQEPCEEGRDEAHLLQELASSGPLYQGKNSCANFQP